jgi:hypothetical protein
LVITADGYYVSWRMADHPFNCFPTLSANVSPSNSSFS